MAIDETMRIRLEADASDIEKKIKEVDKKLSQMEKAEKTVKLRVDIGILTQNLVQAKKILAKFKKEGDQESIIKAQMNVQGIQDALKKTKREFTAVSKSLATGHYAKLSKTLNDLRHNYKNLAVAGKENTKEARNLLKEITTLDTRLKKVDATVGQNQRNVGNYSSALGGLKQRFVGMVNPIVAVGIAFLGLKSIISKSMEFEQTRVSFDVLFGSIKEGRAILEDLTTFAKNTPFSIQGVEENALKLKAYGLATENIIPTLKVFGNISRGQEDIFSRLVYAYGQVTSAGKLYGTELRQFTEAGVPLLDALARQFGVTTGEIRKMTEEGKISAVDVTNALQEMQKEGGRFADLMEKQSQTASGSISNIKDSIVAMQRQFAKTKAYEILVKSLNWVAKNIEAIFGNIGAVIGNTFTFIFGSLALTVVNIRRAFKGIYFSVKNTLTGVLEFIGYAVKTIGSAFDTVTANIPIVFKNAFKMVANGIKEYFLKPIQSGVNNVIKLLNNVGANIEEMNIVSVGQVFELEELKGDGGNLKAPSFDFSETKENWKKDTKELENLKSHFVSSFSEFKKSSGGELNVGDINTDLFTGGGGAKARGVSSKNPALEKEKELAKLRKKQVERMRKLNQERIKDVTELDGKTKKYYENLEKGIQTARDEQSKLRAEQKKFNAELNKSTATDLAGRKAEILAKEKDLKARIQEINESKTFTTDNYKDRTEAETLLKQVREERGKLDEFIKSNNLGDQFVEAERKNALSSTERIIEEYELKKSNKAKEIEDEIAKQQAIIEVNSEGVEQLKTLEDELFRKKNFYLQATEKNLGGSVNRQKKKYQELIDQINTAIARQKRLNSLRGASSSSGSTTNTTNITQNIANRSDADHYIQATQQL